MLTDSIQIIDRSPNITDTADKIKQKIKFAVRREHLDSLYQRLQGWWFGKVVQHLSHNSTELIVGFEVHDRIREIAEQFKPDALPIDFF